MNGQLYYAGNNTATFALRGVHVKLTTRVGVRGPAGGGDTHNADRAWARRRRSRSASSRAMRPEVFVTAADPADHAELFERAADEVRDARSATSPGLAVEDLRHGGREFAIPDELRTGHEAHFAAVMEEFVRYFHTPRAVPPWERPNALAKYYITTKAVEMARQKRPSAV